MISYYKEKISLISQLRDCFNKKGFTELITPVLRQGTGDIIKRVPVESFGYLRDSHELQLRYALSIYDSVYEIGSCFRHEEAGSNTNMSEFLLMEVFSSQYSIEDLCNSLRELLHQLNNVITIESMSVSGYIEDKLKIDLFTQPQKLLFDTLRGKYPKAKFNYGYEYVNLFISEEIEPLTKGKFIFLKDYPECTCSYAKIIGGESSSVVNRVELFANCLEIANGFDDECNADRFLKRNNPPIFENEELVTALALETGVLPKSSAGLGIGIERLCMALYGIENINQLQYISDKF
jgi:lysyl-tRNA synthetase class 2